MIHVCLSMILFGIRVRSDFMLPRVDGGHTRINYVVCDKRLCVAPGGWRLYLYSDQLWDLQCADFLIGELEKEGLALVCVFFFLLPPQSVNIYPGMFFSLYIYPTRHLDAVLISLSSVRADPAYEAINYVSVSKSRVSMPQS